MSLLPVTVIMTTYDPGNNSRYPLLYQTIKELQQNLDYPNLRWTITDDGSPNHQEMVAGVSLLLEGQDFRIFNTERRGVGYAKNNALREAFTVSPIVYLTEDDWLLKEHLDLVPYVQLMLDYPDVAIIRFGYLGGEMAAKYVGYGIGLDFWSLQRNSGLYVYSGQNSLRSSLTYSTLGWHKEGVDPGNEELDMCHRWNNVEHDLKILWPGKYGVSLNSGAFINIGMNTSLNNITPGEK
jgi:hypothetical protein